MKKMIKFRISKPYNYLDDMVINHVIESTASAANKLKSGDYDFRFEWSIFFSFFKAIQLNSKKPIRILDIGGAAGIYYELFKDIFIEMEVEWVIWETISFTEVLQKSDFKSNCLFFNNISDIKSQFNSFDLIILNSVLQYLEDPYELLKEILKFKPNLIHIGKTPFSDDAELVGLQNSNLISHGPFKILNTNNTSVSNEVKILKFDSVRMILHSHFSNVLSRPNGTFSFYRYLWFLRKKTVTKAYDFSAF